MPRAVNRPRLPKNYPDIDFDKVTGTVDSISDLKAQRTNGFDNGDAIVVLGDDENIFWWDSDSSDTADGSTIIKPTFDGFSGTGRWKKAYISVPSVTSNDAGGRLTVKPDGLGYENLTHDPLFDIDYYNLLASKKAINKVYKKIGDGDKELFVMVSIDNGRGCVYRLQKNTNDDYIRLLDVYVAEINNGEINFDEQNATYTGNIVTANPPNYYAQDEGDTINISFTGTKLDFNYLSDDRGGVWEFVLDGRDGEAVEVSTYSASLAQTNTTTLFSGLDNEYHTVVGTFKGDDPSNAPSTGAGNSRGWFKFEASTNSNYTFDLYGNKITETKEFDVLNAGSNKEFAILMSQSGSENSKEWIPEHNSTGTAFSTFEKILIDGVEETAFDEESYYTEIGSLEVIQTVRCKNNNDNVDLCDVTTIHSFNEVGCSITAKLEAIDNIDTGQGYVCMVPCDADHGTVIVDGYGNTIDLDVYDGTTEYFPYRDYMKSVAIFNDGATDPQNRIVCGISFPDTKTTFLYNTNSYIDDNGSERRFWVEHRSGGSLNKMYCQTYSNGDTLSTGFKHLFKMNICVASMYYKIIEP